MGKLLKSCRNILDNLQFHSNLATIQKALEAKCWVKGGISMECKEEALKLLKETNDAQTIRLIYAILTLKQK